jgi:hypothetical protein
VLSFDPVAWLDGQGVKPVHGAAAFMNLLLQDDLATDSRNQVLAAGRDCSLTGMRKALQLVLHCPEFQLA